MTYAQIQERVLKLLNRHSMAGSLIPTSYNNQQDYLNRIPSLVNDAMMEIATTARKIPAVLDLAELEGEDLGETRRYALPEDFYQFRTGDTLLRTRSGQTLHTNRYALQGRNYLLVPAAELAEGGRYEVGYYRYPALLPDKPAGDTELDNVPEAHDAAAFYTAAFLALHDDDFLFASLYNKYEDKLKKLGPGVSAEVHDLDEAAGMGNYGVYEV